MPHELAAGKPSFQSSTYQNNANRFGSGTAVDGGTNNFNHTNRENKSPQFSIFNI